MSLDSPVGDIKGVGVAVAKKMSALGIKTAWQLVDYFPRRYDDYSLVLPIGKIRPGMVTIRANIKQVNGRYARRGLHITEAVASDETGSVRLVWFNQPYRVVSLNKGHDYYISGDFGLRYQRLSIQNPSIELASNFPINTARIVPVYRETKDLKSAQIRRAVREVLPMIRKLPEKLPDWLIEAEGLMSRANAIEQIHFPISSDTLHAAKRRLGFEEIFELTLSALLNKYELLQEHTSPVPFNETLAKDFVKHLPFSLTDDQRKAIWQIYKDIQKTQPMNRLLEGDVGSGKTVVATMAAVMVMEHGFQVALMAPTELLARQHAGTIFKLLEPLGMGGNVGLLVGGLTPAQKSTVHKRIKSGDMRFIIGTNALVQAKVDMHKLGLVIIDEQHRFGVEQRKKLQAKAGHMPHVLSMTATPIPRSLALTLYGELDISIIVTKPANRKPIKTKIISLNARHQLYENVDKELAKGRQVFVVCPLISVSDFMPVRSAEQVYEELRSGVYKNRRIGLLHGKMKTAEKDTIMQAFFKHEIDVLVSTTVVEVGVDVPNATVMIIEGSERYGLAQLHQLRGRVGRSAYQGYCYLLLSDSQTTTTRLKAMERSSDGFKLAEYDLEIRGPGAIYGSAQHGQLDLRIAKLSDIKIIVAARRRAQEFIDKGENLLKYPELYARVQANRAITNLN